MLIDLEQLYCKLQNICVRVIEHPTRCLDLDLFLFVFLKVGGWAGNVSALIVFGQTEQPHRQIHSGA